jgi:hypothetical protein
MIGPAGLSTEVVNKIDAAVVRVGDEQAART